MKSWFSHFADSDGDPIQEDPPQASPEISVDLEPLDYQLLALSLSGVRRPELMERFSLTGVELDARLSKGKALAEGITSAILEKVTHAADTEPVTTAKVEASAAMRRLVVQSKQERDPKVRLAANQAILRYAGVEPARKVEFQTPDRVLEQMTPAELAAFAASRIWPERFRSALRAFMPAAIDVTPPGNNKQSRHIPTEDS